MPAHSGLTGASLHESKGADAATAGQVAVADGAGAAAFGTLVNGSLGTGMVVQVAMATPYTTYATLTTDMNYDNTIPQNTEGVELVTVSITPKSASNKLVIFGSAMLGSSTASALMMALFQDTTANALAVSCMFPLGNVDDTVETLTLLHTMTAGTTSATTFKLRAGQDSGDTGFVNGGYTARRFGGIAAVQLIVAEIKV